MWWNHLLIRLLSFVFSFVTVHCDEKTRHSKNNVYNTAAAVQSNKLISLVITVVIVKLTSIVMTEIEPGYWSGYWSGYTVHQSCAPPPLSAAACLRLHYHHHRFTSPVIIISITCAPPIITVCMTSLLSLTSHPTLSNTRVCVCAMRAAFVCSVHRIQFVFETW